MRYRLWFLCYGVVCVLFVGDSTALGSSGRTASQETQEKETHAEEPVTPGNRHSRRIAAPSELENSRGAEEDSLRRSVLECFSEDDPNLGGVKQLLNQMWTTSSVDSLETVLFDKQSHYYYGMTPDFEQYQSIADLLAYVHTESSSKEMRIRIEQFFEKLFAFATAEAQRGWKRDHYWARATNAIQKWGTQDLLTPAFWKELEKGEMLPFSLFESFGGKDMLSKLKTLKTRGHFEQGSRVLELLEDAILLMDAETKYPEIRDLRTREARLREAKRRVRLEHPRHQSLPQWPDHAE